MANELLPTVMPPDGADPRRPIAGEAIQGGSKSFDIVNRQSGAVTLLSITADTLIAASDWWWRPTHLPFGRQAYFEISGMGSVAGLGVTASLYTAAGVLVAGSTVTTIGLAPTLNESAAITMPSTDTLLQVKFRNSSGALLGTGSLFIARLNIR